MQNFMRKNINDEDLFTGVPAEQHIKMHDQIFVTFNRVSDLKQFKQTEIHQELKTEKSVEPVNLRWFDMDNQHCCQRFLKALAVLLIALFFLAGITAIEYFDLQNSEIDFSYLEPLILVISLSILLYIVGTIMDRMIYINQYQVADTSYSFKLILGFLLLGVIPLVASIASGSFKSLSNEWFLRMTTLYCFSIIFILFFQLLKALT